jgi:competence protein ComEC
MRKFGLSYLVLILCLLVIAFSTSRTAARKDGLLKVYFLDIGQGDAIFIESPNGNQALVDGGPDGKVLSELGKVMPFYDREIDVVILTHSDADHVSGLIPVLERYSVSSILETKALHTTSMYDSWRLTVAAENAEYVQATAGKVIDLGSGVSLTVIYPIENLENKEIDPNDASVVMLLDYKNTEILLTGDLEEKGERELIMAGAPLDVDVLKLGHHGSKTSSAEYFLAATSPQSAIISAGLNNRYGHPHSDVVKRLESFGIPYYRTDSQGMIELTSDGYNYDIVTER